MITRTLCRPECCCLKKCVMSQNDCNANMACKIKKVTVCVFETCHKELLHLYLSRMVSRGRGGCFVLEMQEKSL